jgi:hypothetical protein
VALSDYERRVLIDIEQDLRHTSRRMRARVAVRSWMTWLRAMWEPIGATILAIGVSVGFGAALLPGPALGLTAALWLAVGFLWGRALAHHRRS